MVEMQLDRAARHDQMRSGRVQPRGTSEAGISESSDSRPQSREYLSVAAQWLDRKPNDFVRTMRKAMSEPQLLAPLPSAAAALAAAGAAAAPASATAGRPKAKKFKRAPIETPNQTIERQEVLDRKKEVKDLDEGEKRADMTRKAHSRLIAVRMKKDAECATLAARRDLLATEFEKHQQEAHALRARLEALGREAVQLETELEIEEAATPRYEFMERRAKALLDEVHDKTAPFKHEIHAIMQFVARKGGAHLAAEFDARSKQQAMGRFTSELQVRAEDNQREIDDLKKELELVEENKGVVKDMMIQRHTNALALRGDRDGDAEAPLQAAAAAIGGEIATVGTEKYFSQAHALELTSQFQKLANFFAVETEDQLVEKVLRFHSSSATDKAANLEEEIELAKRRQEGLQEEVVNELRNLQNVQLLGGVEASPGARGEAPPDNPLPLPPSFASLPSLSVPLSLSSPLRTSG